MNFWLFANLLLALVPVPIAYLVGLVPGAWIGTRFLRSRELGFIIDAAKTFATFFLGFMLGGVTAVFQHENTMGN